MEQQAREGAANRTMMAETANAVVEAIQQSSDRQRFQLEAMHHDMRNQDACRAEEHFLVAMNYFNRSDFSRALITLEKSRAIYGGHFPTLFLIGYLSFLAQKPASARNSLEAALGQVDTLDAEKANREEAMASLYLGRLAFSEYRFKEAISWYRIAFIRNNRLIMTTLVESAAARILDPDDDNEAAVVRIRQDFKEVGGVHRFQYWYLLALILAPHEPEWAGASFQQGAALHLDAIEHKRKKVLVQLYGLNRLQVETLLLQVAEEYPWLKD